MRRRVAAPLLLSALAAPAWGGDGRLQLGFDVNMNYEDNVLSNPHDEDGDFYLSAGPQIHAYDERGDLRWRLDYNPTYLKYLEFDELDDWEHYAFGELDWVPDDRTRVFGSAEYVVASSFQRLAIADPTLGDTGVGLATQGIDRTTFEAGVERRLTPRNTATLRLQRFENDYELATRQDVTVTEVGLEWLYDLTARDRTGLDVRYSRQAFGIPSQDESRTDYYNLSLVWQHVFDPTLALSISAGPALVEPEDQGDTFVTIQRFPFALGANGVVGPVIASTCPTLDDGTPFLSGACLAVPLGGPAFDELTTIGVIGDTPSGGGSDTTYFAAVSLTKQWKYVRGELSYTRDTSTSGDLGGNTVRDLVLGRLNWRVTRRFRTDLDLSYQRFESATESMLFVTALRGAPILGEATGLRAVLVDNQREDEIYWARLRFSYDLTPRTVGSLSVIWQTQIADIPPQLPVKVDRLLVIVGFTYRFRSIPLGI